MYVARPKIWVMLKPCGKLPRGHAYGKDFPHATKKAHTCTNPLHHTATATVPSPRATRARYTRRHVENKAEEKGRRRAGAGAGGGEEEENEEKERQGTKDNQTHQQPDTPTVTDGY